MKESVGKLNEFIDTVRKIKRSRGDNRSQVFFLDKSMAIGASKLFAFVQKEKELEQSQPDGYRDKIIYDEELTSENYDIIRKVKKKVNDFLNNEDSTKIIAWFDNQYSASIMYVLTSNPLLRLDAIPFLFALEDRISISNILNMDVNAPFIVKLSELSKKLIDMFQSDIDNFEIHVANGYYDQIFEAYGRDNWTAVQGLMRDKFYSCRWQQTQFNSRNDKQEAYKELADYHNQFINKLIVGFYNKARSYYFEKCHYNPNSSSNKSKYKLYEIIDKINTTGEPTKKDLIGLSSLFEGKTESAIDKRYERGEKYLGKFINKISNLFH